MPDADVTEQVVILKAARARKEAIALADAGDHETARKVLESASEELRRIAPMSSAPDQILEHVNELSAHAVAMAPATYDAATRKAMHYEASRTQRGLRDRSRRSGPRRP